MRCYAIHPQHGRCGLDVPHGDEHVIELVWTDEQTLTWESLSQPETVQQQENLNRFHSPVVPIYDEPEQNLAPAPLGSCVTCEHPHHGDNECQVPTRIGPCDCYRSV